MNISGGKICKLCLQGTSESEHKIQLFLKYWHDLWVYFFVFVKVHLSVNIALHRMVKKLFRTQARPGSIRSRGVKCSITEMQHPDAGGIRQESLRLGVWSWAVWRPIRCISTRTHYSHCLLHLSHICRRKRNGCWSHGQSGRSIACVWPVKK